MKFTMPNLTYYSPLRVRLLRKIPLSIGLLWCILFLFEPTHAQVKEYYFKTLTPNDGLLGNVNAFLFKDSRGFLWVSSMQGLNRYDGQRVRTYTHDANNPNALLNSNIQSEFFEDKNGDIWFCTVEAIHVYRYKQDHFDRFQIKDKQGQLITNLYQVFHLDTEGYLWMRIGSYEKGMLYRWHTSGQGDAQFMHEMSGLRAQAIVNKQGLVTSIMTYSWGVAPAGIKEYVYDKNYRLIAQKSHFSGVSSASPQNNILFNVYKIFSDSSTSYIWLATKQGLVKWVKKQDKYQLFDKFEGEKVGFLTGIARYKNSLWLSAKNNKGVYHFDLDKEQFLQQIMLKKEYTEGGLPYASFDNLHLDKDGNLFLSSWNFGIGYTNLSKNKFRQLNLPSIPNKLDTRSLVEDEAHNIWLSSKGNGVVVLNQKHQILKYYDAPVFKNNIITLYKDRTQRIWIYSRKDELFLFDKKTNLFQKVSFKGAKPNNFSIKYFSQLHNGRLLLGTTHGIYEVITGKKPFYIQKCTALPPEYLDQEFDFIFENNRHEVFLNQVSKHLLVCLFKPNEVKVVAKIQFGFDIYSGIEINEGNFYFASNRGLIHLKQQYDTVFSNVNTIFSGTNTYDILRDKNNNLWLSSDNGILLYNPISHKTKTFTLVDGLQNMSVKNGLEDKFGNFWMGGSNGINVFAPLEIEDYKTLAIPEITGIKVNNKDWKKEPPTEIKQLTQPFSSNNIQIEFVSIDFSDSQRDSIRYSFGLENEENPNWVTTLNDKPSISLFNLSEGTYAFRLYAANSDGIWNPEEKKLVITILPPWYRTVWFYLFCLLLIGLIAWGYVNQRIKRVKTKAAFEQKIAETEMSALRSQMDPHFIYNTLNSINSFILNNVPLQASLYLTDFSILMRKILDFSRENRISLEKEEEILRGYMEMEALRFSFDFDVEISDDLDPWDTQIPTMILQPFVENAIIHGIHKKTEGRGQILVRFEKENEWLIGIVEDNGIGLTKSIENKSTQTEKSHVSKGMQITRDRLAIIQQQTGKEASFNVVARSEAEGGGTRVMVRIPLTE